MNQTSTPPYYFFAIEGLDGCGKTTQLSLLRDKLQANTQRTIYTTQEPTKSPIGLVLRQILTKQVEADPRVVSSLFATDRLHHILDAQDGLLSHLTQGDIVLSDRYYFSSYAYNSVDQPLEKIIAENKQNATLLRPTATLYLDLDPQIAMARIQASRESTDLYETLDYLTQVRENYLSAFDALQGEETIRIINANQSPQQVTNEIWSAVAPFLAPSP